MKIENIFLASLLTKLGHKAKAELVIDDSNGTSLTFPSIAEIAEIAEGVAVDAPDGTYVIANDTENITIVVMGGSVTSYTTEPVVATAEATNLHAEVAETLAAVVEQVVALKAALAKSDANFTALKVSLKHEVEGPGAAASLSELSTKYKIV